MTDGLRWQEVFRGADPALLDKEHGAVSDVPALRRAYWRESAQDRRELLLPFEAAVYGGRPVDQATYDRAAQVAASFRQSLVEKAA